MEKLEICDIIKGKLMGILGFYGDLSLHDDLTSYGLNSIKMIVLIVELEEMFDINFEDSELYYENFCTIMLITERVRSTGGLYHT